MSDVVEVLYRDTVVVESGDNKVIVIEPKVIINQVTGDSQIQSDWNQADNTKKDFIKNKPTIPGAPAWGEIGGDIGNQSDLMTLIDIKENKNRIILDSDNFDEVTANGKYSANYGSIMLDVANAYGQVFQRAVYQGTNEEKYRWQTGGEWNDWQTLANTDDLAKKMDIMPTVLLVNADLNSLNTGGVYSTYQPINAPVSGGYQWYVSVISDGMAITQAAYNPSTKEIYFRMTDMMMWSGVVWQKMATEYDIATLYTALSDSIGDVMGSVNNKVDKVAGKELSTNDYTAIDKAIVDKVAVNPPNPERMYLNGNKEYTEIVSGSGGYAFNVFFTNQDSDVTGYKKLSNIADAGVTTLIATVNQSEGLKLIRTYLYDLPIGVSIHDAGIWTAYFNAFVNSSTGNTQLAFQAFMRTPTGTETTLFTVLSSEINNTTLQKLTMTVNQPEYAVGTDSRFGVRILAQTSSGTIGGQDASYFNSPIALRHSQLRGKNDETAYQHITSDEKLLFVQGRELIQAQDFVGGSASPYQGLIVGGYPVIVKKFLNQNSYFKFSPLYINEPTQVYAILMLTESVMPTAGQYIDFQINSNTAKRYTFTGTETQFTQIKVTDIDCADYNTQGYFNTISISGTYLQKIGVVSLDFFYNRSV